MKQKTTKTIACQILLCFTMASFSAVAEIQYSITDIGALLGSVPYGSASLGINARGDVAITAGIDGNTNEAFFYSGGSITDLGPGNAYSVNNQGQVAGYRSLSHSDGTAFLYSEGTVTGLGFAIAYAINNNGQLVGATFSNRPCIYYQGTVTALSADKGQAFYINDRGDVVGQWDNDGSMFLYSGGTMTNLGIGLPRGINNSGQIVGTTNGRAFIYDGGQIIDLGDWAPLGINDYGDVVGNGHTSFRALLYRGGEVIDLNNLISPDSGLTLNAALCINNNGQIGGFGTTPSGETHAFLLTPIPEPSPILLSTMGAAAVIIYWCRRRTGETAPPPVEGQHR